MKYCTTAGVDRRAVLGLTAALNAAVVIFGLGQALAQQKSLNDQLLGSWTFVSGGAKAADGSSVWGSNPNGLIIFMANGDYSSQILRTDRPKFAANSRDKGTAEENRAAVHGYIGSFGTYSVNEADKTFTVKFEGSSYPNLEGTQQTRPFVSSRAMNCGLPIRRPASVVRHRSWSTSDANSVNSLVAYDMPALSDDWRYRHLWPSPLATPSVAQWCERHVRFLAPLAFVSPRIVTAIADGTGAADLTVTALAKALPYSWTEQEQGVGMRLRLP
jgi:Lipocalin-like domain